MEDFDKFKNNCVSYGQNSNYRDILSSANGKTHYSEIAKKVGVHATTVSSALMLAAKLGLANKDKKGFYKKTAGVMQYIPKEAKKEKKGVVVSEVPKRISKRNKKLAAPSGSHVHPRILNSASKMTEAYHYLYYTENTLRELIRKVMVSTPNWWQSKVPPDVKTNVLNETARVPYHAAARHDELEYTHLGELAKIIMKNWNMFAPFLHEKDKNKFNAIVGYAIPHRNAVGHCIPLKSEHSKTVGIRFRDILNMIK